MGRQLVEALLEAPVVRRAERTYLMTTNSAALDRKLGFRASNGQQLLLRPAGRHGEQEKSR